jgi:hypothetical protein
MSFKHLSQVIKSIAYCILNQAALPNINTEKWMQRQYTLVAPPCKFQKQFPLDLQRVPSSDGRCKPTFCL